MSVSRIPKMSHHKASGQAVVRLGGFDVYLGPWGTKVTKNEYDRVVSEWLAGGRRKPVTGDDGVTVAEVVAGFWDHVESYYRDPNGEPTNEQRNFRDALGFLRRLYGHRPVVQFGPLALKAVRQAMIDSGLCRTNINKHISRIKHVFKWAVENEIVPPSVFHGLQAVAGLRAGRSSARETEPVKPVPEEIVLATLPFLSRHLQAMVQLQLLTGMRPGELCLMRGCDLDTTGKLWLYRPRRHKTAHHGHERVIYIGPQGQKVLQPFLRTELQAFIFSPEDAMNEHREALHSTRKTPMSCGNVPGSNRKRKPRKSPTDRYTTNSYTRAIARACEQAFGMPAEYKNKGGERPRPGDSPEMLAAKAKARKDRADQRSAWHAAHTWHPNQLRHTAATNLRKNYGLEAAQVILGHRTLTVTQVYAEKNVNAAMKIMAEVG